MMLDRRFFLLLSFAALSACAGIQTDSSYDHSATYTDYISFRVESRSALPEPLSREVEAALQRNLSAKGLMPTRNADLLVNFFTLIQDEARVAQTPTNIYLPYRRGYSVWTAYETSVRDVTEGTLFVDVVDARTNKLVWEGNAHGAVSRGDFKRNTRRIESAVEKMLRDFPPKK